MRNRSDEKARLLGLVGSVLALGLSASIGAQEKASPQLSPRHFEVRPATSPIQVDGVLDEPAWAAALTFDLPYEWQPGDNVTPPVATDFYVTFDEKTLYVAWRCHDPEPAAIRAHLMDRDAIDTLIQDDHVLLMLDPFNDERRGWQFRITPLGVQADAINSENEGVEDFSYDMIWAAAARIGADGWVAEAAIPFSQLRFPRDSGPQTWGFDVGRSWPRSVRHRIASWPRDRGRDCVLCQVDKVTGFSGMRRGRALELDPTLTAARTDRRDDFPGGVLVAGKEKTEAGLSARWGVTSDLSLNAALNPDFSQVEADVAQLDVNERFALFYPEKRPFFLEGSEVFATPIRAVYTRTVADPRWGTKLTGKVGANTLGVFIAEDDLTNLLFPANQGTRRTSLDQRVRTGVARWRRDLGRGSTIGVLYTDRQGAGYENRLWAADTFVRFGQADTLTAQLLGSETAYPAELGQGTAGLSGTAWSAEYRHAARDWQWAASLKSIDPDFRADAGFVPRADLRQGRWGLTRVFWGSEGSWWNRVEISGNGGRIEDHDGRRTDEDLELAIAVTGPWQSAVQLAYGRSATLAGETWLDDLNRTAIYAEVQPTGWLRVTFFAENGLGVFFANDRTARVRELVPTFELKLGRHVNAQLSHDWLRFRQEGQKVSDAGLTQLRLVYHFTVRAFVRAIVQRFDLEQDASAFPFAVAAREESLFTQLLFSYKLNPQTVLFVGYADNAAGADAIDLTRTDRTFFVKLGYAFGL